MQIYIAGVQYFLYIEDITNTGGLTYERSRSSNAGVRVYALLIRHSPNHYIRSLHPILIAHEPKHLLNRRVLFLMPGKGGQGVRQHTAEAKRFYKSAAWQKCRASYISKVFGICEHCDGNGYIVDHITEINSHNINDSSITLNHDNLQYLCTPCHNKKTFKKHDSTREGFGFDASGNLVQTGCAK